MWEVKRRTFVREVQIIRDELDNRRVRDGKVPVVVLGFDISTGSILDNAPGGYMRDKPIVYDRNALACESPGLFGPRCSLFCWTHTNKWWIQWRNWLEGFVNFSPTKLLVALLPRNELAGAADLVSKYSRFRIPVGCMSSPFP
jgi:hypothetical protein